MSNTIHNAYNVYQDEDTQELYVGCLGTKFMLLDEFIDDGGPVLSESDIDGDLAYVATLHSISELEDFTL